MYHTIYNIPNTLTVKELAKELKIGRNKAYELVKSNQIQSMRVGKQIRITKQAFIDFIAS